MKHAGLRLSFLIVLLVVVGVSLIAFGALRQPPNPCQPATVEYLDGTRLPAIACNGGRHRAWL